MFQETALGLDGEPIEMATVPKTTQSSGTAGFGARLAELRKAAGFTQQQLADEVGVSRRMVAYYEARPSIRRRRCCRPLRAR